MSQYEEDWFGPKTGLLQPRMRVTENDNAGQKNTLHNYDRLMMQFNNSKIGGMGNWGSKSDPYGTRLPSYLPPPPGNDKGPSPYIVPYSRTSLTEEPGLPPTAPLPPRRPPGMRVDRFGPRTPQEEYLDQQQELMRQHRQRGYDRFDELKRDYPHGAGYPENSPSFPNAGPQFNIKQIDEMIGRPSLGGTEDFADQTQKGGSFPPEYRPQRPIPLGEIQRRWGVPRLEDL